jgi:hypothetical protein
MGGRASARAGPSPVAPPHLGARGSGLELRPHIHGTPNEPPRVDPAVADLVPVSGCVRPLPDERACRDDVAFKVIASMLMPDHSTIAEFRRRHEDRGGRLVRRGLGVICGGRTRHACSSCCDEASAIGWATVLPKDPTAVVLIVSLDERVTAQLPEVLARADPDELFCWPHPISEHPHHESGTGRRQGQCPSTLQPRGGGRQCPELAQLRDLAAVATARHTLRKRPLTPGASGTTSPPARRISAAVAPSAATAVLIAVTALMSSFPKCGGDLVGKMCPGCDARATGLTRHRRCLPRMEMINLPGPGIVCSRRHGPHHSGFARHSGCHSRDA